MITEEIIIKLCTIFNAGWGEPGVIAGNKKEFWEPIIDVVVSDAFSGDLKIKFNEFLGKAKVYRNTHGAHFDQDSFIVTHGAKKPDEDGLIYSVGWSSALLTFDWDFVSETIPVFAKALGSYVRKIQKDAGIVL